MPTEDDVPMDTATFGIAHISLGTQEQKSGLGRVVWQYGQCEWWEPFYDMPPQISHAVDRV